MDTQKIDGTGRYLMVTHKSGSSIVLRRFASRSLAAEAVNVWKSAHKAEGAAIMERGKAELVAFSLEHSAVLATLTIYDLVAEKQDQNGVTPALPSKRGRKKAETPA